MHSQFLLTTEVLVDCTLNAKEELYSSSKSRIYYFLFPKNCFHNIPTSKLYSEDSFKLFQNYFIEKLLLFADDNFLNIQINMIT